MKNSIILTSEEVKQLIKLLSTLPPDGQLYIELETTEVGSTFLTINEFTNKHANLPALS